MIEVRKYVAMCIIILITYLITISGGRTFFIANTNTLLKTAQLYEFQAETPHDKEMYGTHDMHSVAL